MPLRPTDIDALRKRLESGEGPAYWRSLEEVAETDAFKRYLHREFPEGASEWNDPKGRRNFLKVMGASLVLASASGCGYYRQEEQVLSYANQPPEGHIPGIPDFYASAFLFQGFAQGTFVESHNGRPTKVEGNPDHPASLGATSAFAQASILDMYDPDRSTTTLYKGEVSTWTGFVQDMQAARRRLRRTNGAGLRVLTQTVTSPSLASQFRELKDQFPEAGWHVYEPTAPHHAQAGLRQALGQPARVVYRFEQADLIATLDANILYDGPGSVRYARDIAERRRVREGETAMNRLYAAESTPTITGSFADHRLPLAPRRIRRAAYLLAEDIGVSTEGLDDASGPIENELTERERVWVDALAADLQDNAGSGVLIAGETLPPAVHVLVHRINEQLGNVGTTVEYMEGVEAQPVDQLNSLQTLTRDMRAGEVEVLIILGGNPAYSAPVDVEFAAALERVSTTVHLSPQVDETSARCVWHLPQAHTLESWSDARAYNGATTIVQPLIAPLYESCRTDHEVMAVLLGRAGLSDYDVVSSYWTRAYDGNRPFEAFWQNALFDGVVRDAEGRVQTAAPPAFIDTRWQEEGDEPQALRAGPAAAAEPAPADTGTVGADTTEDDTTDAEAASEDSAAAGAGAVQEGDLELIIQPDPSMWDGRFANNAWMHELPKPLTKLTWDNAALMSPATAEALDVGHQEVVELNYQGQQVEAAAWIMPGHADGCVTVRLGYGRNRAGRVGNGVGFSAYRLRTSGAPWGGPGLEVRPLGRTYPLASTQHHHTMADRNLVRAGTVGRFREDPDFVHEGHPIELPSLYPEWEYDSYKWGMVIDQNVCIGCNACVTACQSENNIPSVGKEAVLNGREMHWLRVDRYYKGEFDNPDVFFQPVPCMHCEKAPCEVVCPVAATVHDAEGLNVMVYNRCIGTRYCSNNCPYKVRRFNFLEWNDWDTESLMLMRNPDVSVRSRGVMEKCTYCIQRISNARIQAKTEYREIRDGEVRTACQQACPTNAIVFGDLNNETALVTEWKAQPHNYALLHHTGVRPRTTYLAHLRNPNEQITEVFEQRDVERGFVPEIGEAKAPNDDPSGSG